MTKIKDIVSAICIFFLLLNPALAQTAAILPQGKTQFLDNNGNPLSSGKVYFYIPSTTTFKSTWQDAAETTLNTNPVTLDAGGRAIIYGSGTYRQLVKDRNGNEVYDAVTASAGTGGTTTGTGDGDLVGTVKPWAGLVAPNQYAFAYGQEISRTTYAAFFTATTLIQSIGCTSTSPILTGMSDTSQIPVGAVLEATCIAAGSTVVSKTSTTVTMNNNASLTTATTGVFFLYGNGNGSTTFNVPDLRGNVVAGRCNMGGTDCTNLTTTGLGENPSATGAQGGISARTILTANLPAYTPSGTVSAVTATGTVSAPTITLSAAAGSVVNSGTGASANLSGGGGALNQAAVTASSSTPVFTGTGGTATFTGTAQGGSSTGFSIVQPTLTLNYIIKIIPDSNSADASGVTSFGLMTGDIGCSTGILCTGNLVSLQPSGNSVIGGVQNITCGLSQFINQLASGVFSCGATSSSGSILNADTTYYVRTTPVAVTITNASPAVITHTTHGYLANQLVTFNSTATLPTGLTAGTTYCVLAAGLAANTYRVGATCGGAAINTSSAGSGTFTEQAGNDLTGTGASPTATLAFMTIQGAINYIQQNVNLGNFKATVQAACSGGGGVALYGNAAVQMPFVGGKQTLNTPSVIIQGDTTTPSNCVIQDIPLVGYAFAAEQGSNVQFQGFKVISATAGGYGLLSDTGANLWYGNVEFGAMSGGGNPAHVNAHAGGRVFCIANYSVTGSSGFHWSIERSGFIECAGVTITITGTPNFTGAFAYADNKGHIYSTGLTFVGSATGPRYFAQYFGEINTGSASTTYFPGNSAGTPSATNTFTASGVSCCGLYN